MNRAHKLSQEFTRIKLLAVFVVVATLAPGAFAAPATSKVVIDDFEKGNRGWSGYSDREDLPLVVITDEAISGDKALEVTFRGCKSYQGLHIFNAAVLPEKAVGISFLIKPISGAPPVALCLENPKLVKTEGQHMAVAVGIFDVKGNDWQKVTIPFSKLIYGSGPKQSQPFPPLEPGAVYTLRFYGPVVDAPSVFLLDDFAWVVE